ncbi:MAG: undecaprenyl-diphosphatase UppP [Armatimonadetes bacterium]|nr:undecaprenyl-diphosphatase UppP [Armatimonadota bacterium]
MILHAAILGIVQGLTEFLPISSSAHLVTLPQLLRWKDMGLAFDVALHLGTLAAIISYFRHDWASILRSFLKRSGAKSDVDGRMLVPIIVACIPAAVAGALLDHKIEGLRTWPALIPTVAVVLMVFGLVMLLAERVGKKNRGIEQMNWIDYIVIGFAQALALFAGVSRSGITISAGLFLNLNRAAAARFSFLLATPIILGAGLLELAKLLISGFPPDQAAPFAVGFIASTVSGYLAIRFLMGYLARRPLDVFVTYRFVFAIFLLLASQ